MSELSLANLSFNLKSLSVGMEECPSNPLKSLVPSFSGKTIYSKGFRKSVFQLLWKIDACVRDRFSQERALLLALSLTQKAVIAHTDRLGREIKVSEKCFEKAKQFSHWTRQEERDLLKARKVQIEMQNFLSPILKRGVFPNLLQIQALYDQPRLSPLKFQTNKWIELKNHLKESHHHLKILKLQESVKGGITSIRGLYVLHRKEALTAEENRSLKQWVLEVNKANEAGSRLKRFFFRKKPLRVHQFHSTLLSLVRQFNQGASEPKVDSSHLEWELKQLGVKLFSQVDPKQMAFRKRASSTKEIRYFDGEEEKVIQLDQLIQGEIGLSDELVFTLKDQHSLLVLPKNGAELGIEERESQYVENRVEIPKRLEIKLLDSKGRFKIIERGDFSLQNIQWDSLKDKKCEKKIIQLFRGMIKTMVEESYTPKELSLKTLLLINTNDTPEIRTTKVLKRDFFDFKKLRDLSFEFSQNRLSVFKRLIKRSSLPEHHYSLLFKEILDNSLQKEPRSIKDLLQEKAKKDPSINQDPTIMAQCEAFAQSIKNCVEGAEKRILEDYIFEDPEREIDLRARIHDHLLKFYDKTFSMGRLWEGAEKVMIKRVSSSLNLKLKKNECH